MCPDRSDRGADGRGRHSHGFTLIEVMIVVACIAILAAIVLPSYQSSVRKARRTDAKGALTNIAQLMERYGTEHGSYVGATLGSGATDLYKTTSENGYYTLTLSNLAASTYLIQAVAAGAQAADSCVTYRLDQAGTRTSLPGATSDCW